MSTIKTGNILADEAADGSQTYRKAADWFASREGNYQIGEDLEQYIWGGGLPGPPAELEDFIDVDQDEFIDVDAEVFII